MIKQANWQCLLLDFSSTTGYRVKRRTVTSGYPVVYSSGTDTKDPWFRSAPASIYYEGLPYDFAFWSLTARDTTSPQQSAQIQADENANESFSDGEWIITANAYYIRRPEGSGPGTHGFVWIDAFDIQLGDFIPDDFVDVKPDPTGTLTVDANNGFIDTTTEVATGNPITIAARDKLPGKQFANWLAVVGKDKVDTSHPHDIVAQNSDVIIAFSFYNEVPSGPRRVPVAYNWWWWAETMWGRVPPGPPLGPIDPWVQQVFGALSLQGAAQTVDPQLRRRVLEIALEQLKLSVHALEQDLKRIS